jgi:hypothetical protein
MADPTAYIVLRRDDEEGKQVGDMLKWTVVGRANTGSPTGAIREVATRLIDGNSGTFAAVPARSWKPVTVRAEQTVTLKIEQAT